MELKNKIKLFAQKYFKLYYIIILLICLAAFRVRVPMAEMRLPYLQHYDEPLICRNALDMIKDNDYVMRGVVLCYSGFMTYACIAIDYVHFCFLSQTDPIISKTKSFKSVMTDQEGFYRNPSHPSFYYWNRIFVVILSCSSFYVLFLIGKYFSSPWAGIFSSAILLTSFYNFETAATVNVDVPGGLWVLICLLFALQYMENLNIRYLYWSVAMTGMAISTKVSFFSLFNYTIGSFLDEYKRI